MARVYTFNCFSCDEITIEKVEFTPPDNTRQSGNNRFVVDLDKPASDHNGYPPKTILCPKCNLPVIGHPEATSNKVAPVYFNYMGDD